MALNALAILGVLAVPALCHTIASVGYQSARALGAVAIA